MSDEAETELTAEELVIQQTAEILGAKYAADIGDGWIDEIAAKLVNAIEEDICLDHDTVKECGGVKKIVESRFDFIKDELEDAASNEAVSAVLEIEDNITAVIMNKLEPRIAERAAVLLRERIKQLNG